jgi:phosphate:Na+ symporter
VAWMLIFFHPFLRGIDLFLQEVHGASLLNTALSTADFESIKYLYPIGLALFHTCFNILNTAALIGFSPFIAKVATKMVPDKGEDDEEFRLKYISAGLVSTSEIALIQAGREIADFGKRLERMFTFFKKMGDPSLSKKYHKLLAKVAKYEQITDNMEVEIAKYLTKVSEGEISFESSKKIRIMLKMIDDMESVGDAIYQLSLVFDNYNQSKSEFTDFQVNSLNEMYSLIMIAFGEMQYNLNKEIKDVDITKALEIELQINEKRNELRTQHFEDLKEKKYKHKTGTFYSDMFSITEKIGDYIINVSEAIEEFKDKD